MILVIQNGPIPTHIDKYIKQLIHIVKSYEENVSLINLNHYAAVVILGGPQRISLGIPPELNDVIGLIDNCAKMDKPLLGICLGCQLIAYYFGCEIRSSGTLRVDYLYKNIFRCHYDYIVPNDKITVLEEFEGMPYFINTKKMYGIQYHPDIPPEFVNKYLDNWEVANIAEKKSDIIDKHNQSLMDYLLNLIYPKITVS